ncbi:alkyl hydroperoxide reductase/ Thiol specific antioxidant/ Mal allergen [Pseudodesulfovibrio mercurii]|uniref:Alkyl hydroperoxide reductase/ Thiol specific antioxidant/ Mal allergen n=1 Tax=Pseudodesulfovibrio mercurii TaxID=641491 RepID=F0JBP2_9BACT|nr:TlpA disulfide reductase family protein [Pseudodesulfovibrio mercurii]EGB15545.1 alkyl hydroperoxide reductase/ Thiol specific antioxidant/ Mal allergen [Pseudodesulfovibrio mercurii]
MRRGNMVFFVSVLALLLNICPAAQAGPVDVTGARDLNERIQAEDGRPLLLVYWASWCPHCRVYLSQLGALRDSYPEKDLRILGVSLDTDRDHAREFLSEHPLPFPVLLSNSEVVDSHRNKPIPQTILYGADGVEKWRFIGEVREKRLNHYIKLLIKQAEQ